MKNFFHTIIGPAAALFLAVLMAFNCSEPLQPLPPTPPEPEETQSEALKDFLQKNEIGLYIDSDGIVIYDETSFQQAWSRDGASFRIQRDDQTAYLNIRSSSQSASASYQVEYMNQDHSVTLMLLKLQSVQTQNSRIWLWNETKNTGVIVPEGILD